MSDDLISKKAVIALIDKLGYINVSNRDNFNANLRMDKVRQEVVKLPTAFDKEKVIGELKGISEVLYKAENFNGAACIDKSIQIIEKGGIE